DEAENWSALSNVASGTFEDNIPPAAVTDLAVASVTGTSATLTWTAPGDDNAIGRATSYDIRWSTATITESNWGSANQVSAEPAPQAAGEAETLAVTVITTSETSATVAGLNANETYYFALKCTDDNNNTSALSNVPSTQLADITAPEAVTDLTVVGATDTSVTLSWTAPGDDGDEGTATSYDIRYSPETITTGNWASATPITGEPAPQAAGSSESLEVTIRGGQAQVTIAGIAADTTWYFALTSTDENDNTSTLSNVVGTTLVDLMPPAAVTDLFIQSTTANSATLSWTAPGDDGNAGTATAYDVRFSADSITEANWNAAHQATGESAPQAAGSAESFEVTVRGSQVTVTVAGVAVDSTWYFALKTRDESNNTSLLSNVVKSTFEDQAPPSAVNDLAIASVTDSSIVLTWTAPGDDGTVGTAASYDIRYSTSFISEGSWNSLAQASGEPTPQPYGAAESYEIVIPPQGQQDQVFYVALKARDAKGNVSSLSNVVNSALLDVIPPAAIADLSVLRYTDTSVTLRWTAPGDDSLTWNAAEYDIRYGMEPITDGNFATMTQVMSPPHPSSPTVSHEFTIYNLSGGNDYYFAIRTRDESANWSGLSNVVSVMVPINYVVTFPDAGLEAAIRSAINKPTGDIMSLELLDITYLTASNANISDLTGLEWCDSLETLNLRNNQISDITPLTGLTSLGWLRLDGNQITDIDSLAGLTSLTFLQVSENQISDVSALSGLTELEVLYLRVNPVSDLAPLSGLTQLTYLDMSSCSISNVTPLGGLTSLNTLYLDYNAIVSIAPLAPLTNLLYLSLTENAISDISALSGMTQMIGLDINRNTVSDLSALSGMTQLDNLWLVDNNISDLTPISGLTALTTLWLYNNNISSIAPLSGMTGMTQLSLFGNSISDI
ncbi:MAG TPA: leucine-rich repeat domain-containing protein, partial [candidate division Zixibacteria bacterium]|nr:leucine-rich repeat domain-containing protein [candidate division Zixibacteria bacterium]